MKSGFISVVGRPNVGKSTLVNALVGKKVAITSQRPQTTRNTIRGVLTLDAPPRQLVFVDTPGLHKPRTALGERLNRLVYGSLADADIVLFVIDAKQLIGPGDRLIAERLSDSGTAVVVAVNKLDAASPTQIADQLVKAAEWDFAAYVPVSALRGDAVEVLVDELSAMLDDGPAYFPPDMHTDQPDELLAAEIVREKYLSRLREELPHSLAVVVEEITVREDGTVYIAATVFVERDSQKGIAIGRKGELMRSVGEEARLELESMFGAKVYLELRVKVEKDWQRREELLDRMGF